MMDVPESVRTVAAAQPVQQHCANTAAICSNATLMAIYFDVRCASVMADADDYLLQAVHFFQSRLHFGEGLNEALRRRPAAILPILQVKRRMRGAPA
jgi:hypothetical protein